MQDHGNTWHIAVDTGGTFTDCLARPPDGGGDIRLKVLSASCLRGELVRRLSATCYEIRQAWPFRPELLIGYAFRRLSDQAAPDRKVLRMDPTGNRLYLDGPTDIPDAVLPCLFELRTGEEAPILAARLATGTPLDRPLPPIHLRLGTTKGTNALLEGKVAPVLFLTTEGFGDLLQIGTQQRPDLFQLDIPPASTHYRSVVEVSERLAADGAVLLPLTDAETDRISAIVRKTGARSVAIALLHAWAYPVHERKLADALDRMGVPYRSVSHILSPTLQLLPRAQTCVVNACLQPVLSRYLDGIRSSLRITEAAAASRLQLMGSAGELTEADAFHAKDSLLSGPAGGVVGVAAVADKLGLHRVIGFDMGGTSTDASRYDGQFDYGRTTRVGRLSFSAPCLAIETVAAGGGSVCGFDGHQLVVGPESAGADPGPACYGAGGPLTLTDVNLLLDKLDPRAMGIPIHRAPAMQALENIRAAIRTKTGQDIPPRTLLEGFELLANEKMAEAIRRISIARGFDPADYALVAFGGAGGLHACQVAALLHIRTVVLPFDAGLLSAYGIARSAVSQLAERQILRPLDACLSRLPAIYLDLLAEARQALAAAGPPDQTTVRAATAALRQTGQTTALLVDLLAVPFQALEAAYRRQFEELYGYAPDDRPLEVEYIRVVAEIPGPAPMPAAGPPPDGPTTPTPGGGIRTIVWENLRPDDTLSGPAVLTHALATAFLPTGWSLNTRPGGDLVLVRQQPTKEPTMPASAAEPTGGTDPVRLALFTNRFRAIAQEMGTQLQRTARSVNIKERLDFSCALMDAEGMLLVNAPHIPVHLGSLGMCARHILRETTLGPGDVILTNHPAYGGSHLPDLTLLQAVFGEATRTEPPPLIGYVINRAHHAELGGTRPGSMPPDARRLSEEGVVFPPCFLVRGGIPQWEAIEHRLRKAPYPSRSPEDNLADLAAALASLQAGARQLHRLAATYGTDTLHRHMKALQAQAADALLPVLAEQAGRIFRAIESLDDGTRLCVRLTVREKHLDIDFDGTSPTHPLNLNANRSVVYSVVLYVLRLLCRNDIPLNEGLLRPVSIRLPSGTCLDPGSEGMAPDDWPAVVGGNTEVSQRLTDTLLKALSTVLQTACSQGTMNNLLFGNERFGYYETIGGGTGAGRGFHGRSGVHQHMTNTRMTDPEELEHRYPVRVKTFALRRGSGGLGHWRGGDGLVRTLTFLEPVEVTVLSQHRRAGPYGLAGGQAGRPGRQWVVRNGIRAELESAAAVRLEAGDSITIETPGGGGYGAPGD